MMAKRILVFNHREQDWKVWMGQQSYWIVKAIHLSYESKIDIFLPI